MGKYSRLGRNTLLVFVGNAGAKLIGLFMLPFYTNWLSVEDYGTTDMITVYVSFLMGIVTCSITDAIFIFPKGQEKKVQEKYFSSAISFLGISFCLTAFLFLLLELISKNNNISNSFFENIWLIYGMLVSMVVQQFAQQFTRSIDKMWVYSITGIILTSFTAILAILLIPVYGVIGYVISIIGANLVAALYSVIFSKGYSYFSINAISIPSCKEMLKYSIPMIPNGIMWWLVNAFNRPLMETYLGMHAIGIFAVSNKFPGILSMIFTVFISSWQISVLEEFGKKGYEVFFNRIFRTVVVGLIFIFLCITLFSKPLVMLFASEEYIQAWEYIPILSLGAVFSCISGFLGTNFSASRESKYFFYSSILGALTAIFMNFILVPNFDIWGASLSVLLSFMVMSISRIYYGWKYVHITDSWKYLYMMGLCILFIFSTNTFSQYYINIPILLIITFFILLINKDIIQILKDKIFNYIHNNKN